MISEHHVSKLWTKWYALRKTACYTEQFQVRSTITYIKVTVSLKSLSKFSRAENPQVSVIGLKFVLAHALASYSVFLQAIIVYDEIRCNQRSLPEIQDTDDLIEETVVQILLFRYF